ncbi:MAG TPA: hypothetical protein VFM03_07875 [Candidatus Limnocylindria bacterium]|jgi:hypothetical protein|nr:hypothetical protein [Candidatus Limnocylindria bacterium]
MTDRLRRRRRLLVAPIALLGALAVALTAPMPSVPDDGLTTVRAEVADRLPGWRVDRLEPSWEGGYTVVTSCAGLELDFQLVPGHGLPAEDAWVQPSDAYARSRLRAVSDHWRYLVWYRDPVHPRSLSCSEELARLGGGNVPIVERRFD